MFRYAYDRDFEGKILGTYAITEKDGVLCVGFAKMNPNEQAVKAVGREIAEARALDAFDAFNDLTDELMIQYRLFPKAYRPTTVGLATTLDNSDLINSWGYLGLDDVALWVIEEFFNDRG